MQHKALLVDDDADYLEILSMVLRQNDFEPTARSTGAEALELLKTGNWYELVLCDWMMPDMNGEAFYTAMQKIPLAASIVFVVLSSYAPNDQNHHGSQALDFTERTGCEWLMKPKTVVDIQEMLKVIRERQASRG